MFNIFEKINSGEVYVIAEMSANHGGKLDTALEIVRQAAEAGADCLKIQTYTADSITINYDSEDYYQNHKQLKYYTENGEYILEVYACTKDNPLEEEKETMQSYIENIKNNSLINTSITPTDTDKQIVLTTCTRAGSKNEPDLRISVHTKVTPVWEKQIEKNKSK